MLENVVNERFHQTEDGHQKGVATAKSDSYLVLKVPPIYHQNQDHFFRVVQLLPMIDTPELRARRITLWSQELLDPKTAGVAAMKLEGLGNSSIDSLQAGVKSTNPQVQFFCAEALAYLNDTAGVEALGNTVAHQPDFRNYALAALCHGSGRIPHQIPQTDGRARNRSPLWRVQRLAHPRCARRVLRSDSRP